VWNTTHELYDRLYDDMIRILCMLDLYVSIKDESLCPC
jgi:hypothetical protein